MFAVIKTGGKQYRVAAEDVLKVDKLPGELGQIIELPEVLVVGGDNVVIGNPTVSGATVAAEVVEQGRGRKVIAFKKRRRKNSRRKRGHRQDFTLIRITEILTDGKRPSQEARPRAAAKPKAPAKPAEDAETEATPKGKARAAAKPKARSAKTPAAKGKSSSAKGKGKK
jgi:large subunit ribosomal protein L21